MTLSRFLIAFVAFQHIAFLILEMFLWRRPAGRKIFKMTKDQAEATAVLAKNQGLYNGFLAAGLIWALTCPDPHMALSLAAFFLSCVAVAGVYGGLTADKGILIIQALPATMGLASLFF